MSHPDKEVSDPQADSPESDLAEHLCPNCGEPNGSTWREQSRHSLTCSERLIKENL